MGLDIAADPARPRRRGDRMMTARVHHAARRRGGGVAARGAGAAGRADAAHRRAHARSPRTIRNGRPALRRSCRGCRNWAGPTAATCGSTSAGPQAMPTRIRRYAAEFVALAPDVILATGAHGMAAVAAGDPHRADRVRDRRRSGRRRLRRQPGAAGRQRHRLHSFEYGMSGKWLELLKEIAPRRDAGGGASGSRHHLRHRPVRARSSPRRRRSGWK